MKEWYLRKGFFRRIADFPPALYFKIWEETYVMNDYNNYLNAHSRSDYFINSKWKEIFKKRCICPNNFFEFGYKLD